MMSANIFNNQKNKKIKKLKKIKPLRISHSFLQDYSIASNITSILYLLFLQNFFFVKYL